MVWELFVMVWEYVLSIIFMDEIDFIGGLWGEGVGKSGDLEV